MILAESPDGSRIALEPASKTVSTSIAFQAGLPGAGQDALTSPLACELQTGQTVGAAARSLRSQYGLGESARLAWRGEVLLRLNYKRQNYLVHVLACAVPPAGTEGM